MSKEEGQDAQTAGEGVPRGRLIGSAEGEARARKLFAHAQKAADTRNYDYAIELYVNGLAHWPNAIEEGLKKLRVVATARQLAGGKPPGFMTARKYPTGGKDAAVNLNNALHLFGLNPSSAAYMEQILQLAATVKCDAVVQWIAPVLADAYNSGKKLSASHYQTVCDAMDAGAELAILYNNDDGALEILKANMAAAAIWSKHYPDSSEAPRAQSSATGKLTIVKGKFSKADGFADSLKDAELQQELHDRDKQVHTLDRTRRLIEQARRDWEAHPDVPNKLLTLADLIARIPTDESENEAIALLQEQHAKDRNYVFKQKADELRMRQSARHHRDLVAKAKEAPADVGIREALEAHVKKQIEVETAIFEDRHRQYPTELRVKFQLARRYFQARRYDAAIPLFQAARADGRVRGQSRLYLGRCFYNKQFHEQAVDVLRRGVEELESRTSALAISLNYWLGRALEAAGQSVEAGKTYGYLIQLDYNYLDARQRLERLVAEGEK